ncbi:MAG: HAMP domain-containing histidine kinase [Clostridium butyricum]|nr:HAMP domain-containing histidine kinase [Clostridium butyricum]
MVINIIFISVICILIGIIFSLSSKLRYICSVLDDVLNGNLNQRIRIQSEINPVNKLVIKINIIIEQLQQVNKKSIVNEESRKKMISNISHDLRTPLTSMLGYMELIFEDDSLDEDKKNEYLKVIYNKGNSLYGLMEEFFQVSKLDSEDIALNFKKLNLSELIRQNIVSFFSDIQKLNIKPKINIGENDIYFVSDEKVINRILSNLIINIIKHGASATELGIDLEEDDKFILINVWDNGVGISSDEIDHIFDRLYTVEKSRSTSLKNSGLGLTIVKKLVESLEGTISVQSKSYEKTIFTIRLPKGKMKKLRDM